MFDQFKVIIAFGSKIYVRQIFDIIKNSLKKWEKIVFLIRKNFQIRQFTGYQIHLNVL